MYSLGTSFLTTESLVSSFTHLQGEVLPVSTSALFAAPVTIDLKFVCTFCENSFEVTNGLTRTGEMKQLEDIALEHFKRFVLKAGEESLGDSSAIFPDDDGTRYRKLLGSVMLCNGCVFHFARSEQVILKDQMIYLEKMSGAKKLEDVFADPWLDIKRLTFHKLKGQESTIREKLQLMEKYLSSEEGSLNPNSSSLEGTGAASTSSSSATSCNGSTTTTTAQQMLFSAVSVPTISETNGDVISMDISEIMDPHPSKQSTPYQSVVTVPARSNRSSCVGSPKPDKDNENSNDSTSNQEMEEEASNNGSPVVSAGPSHFIQQQNKIQSKQVTDENENSSKTSDESKEESSTAKEVAEKTPERRDRDEGNNSDAESVVSSSSRVVQLIPAIHMSPVVRLKPLSVFKTPPPSASKATTGELADPIPSSRKLVTNDEIEDLLNGNDADDVDDGEETICQNNGDDDEDDESQNLAKGEQPENSLQTTEQHSHEVEEVAESQVKTEKVQDGSTGNTSTSTESTKKNQCAAKPKPSDNKEYDSSQDMFEDSNDDEDGDKDSDESFRISNSKKKGKRKRVSGDSNKGGKRKKLQVKVKFPFGKTGNQQTSEKELLLASSPPSKATPKTSNAPRKSVPIPATSPAPASAKETSPSAKTSKKLSTSSSTSSCAAAPSKPSPFLTPAPKTNRKGRNSTSASAKKESSDDSDGGKRKSFSVVDYAREKIGMDVMNKIGRTTRASPRKVATVTPTEKQKKYFMIGNRYMTDPSSDSDDSDSDESFAINKVAAQCSDSE